ncbi:MAG: tRNA modification GTPase MnmE [candidate division WS2 bacterium]|uniref:tRNA modification GTPase MnmE n=1 Tax=Psychracetigena formicireducens TaxID=2986056 RepID=A0A9E2F0X7_PSYF1|nr:tRNA modification GTPase MnmE [Candidatus Psychracetigena formicireducens]MBT9144869.1 tRNA modification GTPase MnmE [Candidatus Psychracetigena formicireducens]MBT9150402.1 tRNA modification GTPase MnmE [Candidatus Psychracetigena formicireducens]
MIARPDKETISAISTPIGVGAMGIVRVSGPQAISIGSRVLGKNLSKLEPRKALYGFVRDPETGNLIDEVVFIIYHAPSSYTGEDMLEIFTHGGLVAPREVLQVLLKNGVRLAERGEFARRGFLNNKMDLVKAQGIIDVVDARSQKALFTSVYRLKGEASETVVSLKKKLEQILVSLEATVDFPEEVDEEIKVVTELYRVAEEMELLLKGMETSRRLRQGLKVVIIGKTNVGKSSLYNALLQEERAIVTSIPGTTRDVLESQLEYQGYPILIYDTAGIRATSDEIETISISRTRQAVKGADMVLLVIDASIPLEEEDEEFFYDLKEKGGLIILNKIDLPEKIDRERILSYGFSLLETSARMGSGIDNILIKVVEMAFVSNLDLMLSEREANYLGEVLKHIRGAVENISTLDIVGHHLREGVTELRKILGEEPIINLTEEIFKNFCVGK